MAHEQPRRDVDIFWDLGSCPVPTNTSGFTVVSQIRTLALRLGIVKSFKAYLSISDQDSNDQALTPRSELQSSGMSLTDVKQEIADMLIVDMLVHAFDRNSQNDSSIIMLIAGDPRFSYLLSILRKRNYRVVVLGPGGGQDDYLNKSASLASQANSWLDWNTEIMDSIRAEIPRSATAGANSASQTTENLDLTPDTGSERTSETKEKRAGAIDKDTSDRMQPGRDHNTEVNSSVEVVIEHYNARPDVGVVQRQEPSPTVHSNNGRQYEYQSPSSSSSSSTTYRQIGGRSGAPERHARTSPPSMPPSHAPPLPPGSSSVPGPPEMNSGSLRHPTSPFATSSIPYRPARQNSPPGSVVVPLSQQEIEIHGTFRGQGEARSKKKERTIKRDDTHKNTLPQPSPQASSVPSARSHAGDFEVVVRHFDERPDVGIVQRQKSPIIGLKSLNNWVKSVLIIRFAYPALQKSSVSSDERGRRGGGRGKVLDMGCGKGGDLVKWSKARIKELLCVEFAAVSVEQARSRYQSMDPSSFEASFASLDYYTEPLAKAFSPEKLSTPFDVVSMQFRMQYAFETLEKTRTMLGNVSRYLRPGGVFVGTIPDADLLMQELDALPPDTDDLSFGNNVYQIRFEQREPRPVFGHKYWLSLQDAVEDVPEYVVHWDNFVDMAAEYGLYPTYKKEFHQVFDEHMNKNEFRQLLGRMKVINAKGESNMSEDEWKAANIYIAFAFEKR